MCIPLASIILSSQNPYKHDLREFEVKYSQPLGTVLVCACITYRAYGTRKGKGDCGDIRDGQNLDAILERSCNRVAGRWGGGLDPDSRTVLEVGANKRHRI